MENTHAKRHHDNSATLHAIISNSFHTNCIISKCSDTDETSCPNCYVQCISSRNHQQSQTGSRSRERMSITNATYKPV